MTGMFTVSCKLNQMSNFFFDINGSKVGIPGSAFVLDMDLDDSQCILAIEKSEASENTYVWGKVIARSMCWQIDFEQNTIQGFYAKDLSDK
jgi:hypothetical protein